MNYVVVPQKRRLELNRGICQLMDNDRFMTAAKAEEMAKKIVSDRVRRRKKAWNPEWYAEYLRSEKWKAIKERVLRRDCGFCLACAQIATTVHHRSYDDDVMNGRRDGALVSLCQSCHTKIEFRADGTKASLEEANARLDNMLK